MPYPPIPPLAYLSPVTMRALGHAVNLAFGKSFNNTTSTLKRAPGEVDLVLGMFLDGLDDLEVRWNSILGRHGAQVTISGIFAHATPWVTPSFNSPNEERLAEALHPNSSFSSCELGDLLVVVLPVGHPDGVGNSALFQAKIGFPGGGNPLQRQLYEYASHFSYSRPMPLTSQYRCILDKHHTHLSYWDLGSCPASRYAGDCIAAIDARAGNNVTMPFSTALVRLLRGRFGKGFRIPTSAEISWSRVMYDLFRVTAERAVNWPPMNVRGVKRGPSLDDLIWRTAAQQGGPLIVRNSLGKVFRMLGDELENYGEKIERMSEPPPSKLLRKGFENPPRPPITLTEVAERDPNAISIVFINVSNAG